LTVNVLVTFKTAFAGAKNVYAYVDDNLNLNSGWQNKGSWTVPTVGITADSPYQVKYASNLTIGDSVVNITNTGALGAGLGSGTTASVSGAFCANVYTYDPSEAIVSCCSCPVTPNGLVSLSAKNDLINNPLTRGNPTAIVIKLVATVPVGGTCNNSALLAGTPTLAEGMAAWGTAPHANSSAAPGTVGDPLIPRETTDAASGYLYAYDGAFGAVGSVLTWSFNAGSTNPNLQNIAGHQITPIILDTTTPGGWTITGIGATRTVSGVGLNTFSFDLVSGSNMVGPKFTFGWYDGSATASNQGTISFDRATTTVGFRDFVNSAFPVLGNSYVTQNDFTGANNGTSWSGGRIYSVQFATTAAFAVTETAFTPASLSTGELARLAYGCGAIANVGSGFGVCNSCRPGGLGAAR
jgi:hypothetical protein